MPQRKNMCPRYCSSGLEEGRNVKKSEKALQIIGMADSHTIKNTTTANTNWASYTVQGYVLYILLEFCIFYIWQYATSGF